MLHLYGCFIYAYLICFPFTMLICLWNPTHHPLLVLALNFAQEFSNISLINNWRQIPDVFPVLAAAHKTLVSKSRGSLTTRTLHSELVYNYSGSKHVILSDFLHLADCCLFLCGFVRVIFEFNLMQITESLRRCGISDSSSYVLAACFNTSPDEVGSICQAKIDFFTLL